ncbi:MAG TPA: hypothetical protein VFU93_08255 [Acidimicrobiales bacterium]|nr:hypothetical protein [Acidimicrobiales bacterium]
MIREQLRLLAGTATVGLVIGALVGGVLGRLAMRLLVLTSDDRLDGALTDDEAVVNQFTLSGTVGLIFFLGLGGIALAWLYLGARQSLPTPLWMRSAIWAGLLWAVMGSQVFDPDGFDFTQLSPTWLGVIVFSAIFVGVGALIPVYAERAIERWPSTWPAHLPLLAALPAFPIFAGGIVAVIGAGMSAEWRLVRWFGSAVMVAIAVLVGVPVVADVVRIL